MLSYASEELWFLDQKFQTGFEKKIELWLIKHAKWLDGFKENVLLVTKIVPTTEYSFWNPYEMNLLAFFYIREIQLNFPFRVGIDFSEFFVASEGSEGCRFFKINKLFSYEANFAKYT